MKTNLEKRNRLSINSILFIFSVFAVFLSTAYSDAATYYTNDFTSDTGALSLESKWQRVTSGGVSNSPCIRLTYDTTGTANQAAVLHLNTTPTNTVWVKFAYKATGTPTGGSKFLKIFGSALASQNNTTFIMDYFSNTLNRVLYYLDTICESTYTGSTSGGCSPTFSKTNAALNPADGLWHTYKVYLKRADQGTTNGAYRIFSDGTEIVSASNVDNNPSSGYTPSIDRIEWGGYRNSNGTGTWYLWVDDITVSSTDPDANVTGVSSITPSTSISSPANGAVLSGTTTITASASDSNGINNVELYVDGSLSSSAATTPYSFNLNTTGLASGNHTLQTKAYDPAGNVGSSDIITVMVSNVVTDTQSPSIPGNLSATSTSSNQANLTWIASTDNVAVTGYKIYRNGTYLNTVTSTTTTDSGLSAATTYTYSVSAIDAANNESSKSSSVSVTTPTQTASVTTLLSEGFEDSSFSSRGWFDDGTANSSIVTDVTRGKVLEISYLSGATTPSSGVLRHSFPEADDITVTYWVKYQPNWLWTGLGYGPHEFYLLNNLDDRYIGPATTHLTGYIESQEGIPTVMFQDALNIDQTKIGASLKGTTENRSVMGCNGTSDSYPTGDCYNRGDGFYLNGKFWKGSTSTLSLNTWHKIQTHIKLNSIVNNIGQTDGIIQYWIDDVLLLNLNNVAIRTANNPSIKFNEFMIGPYFHGGTKQAQKFWVDDLNITTSTSSQQNPESISTLKVINVIK